MQHYKIDKGEPFFAIFRRLIVGDGKRHGGTDHVMKIVILSEIISWGSMPYPARPSVAKLAVALNLTRKTVSKHIREIWYGWHFFGARLRQIFTEPFVEDLAKTFERYASNADKGFQRGRKARGQPPRPRSKGFVDDHSLPVNDVNLTPGDEETLPRSLRRPSAQKDKETDDRQDERQSDQTRPDYDLYQLVTRTEDGPDVSWLATSARERRGPSLKISC